jgi:pimeloyl-ACP methyl ester carboxylesterase
MSYGTGLYAASEHSVFLTRNNYRAGGNYRGVILGPGHGGTAIDAVTPTYTNLQLEALADAGIPTLVVDAGGATAWGNDTAIARMGDAKTYLQGTLGAKTGKIFLWGFSMGALSALNWARTNLSSVAAIALVCPATDLADLHDNRGFGTEINTAYTNLAGYTAALPTHSPVQFASTLTVPCKVWYGDADTTIPPSTVTAFNAAYGGSISTVAMAGIGHNPVPVPPQDVVSFLTQYA